MRDVGRRAAEFAAAFASPEWGRVVGMWHDLGKYSAEFQAYLRSANGFETQLESLSGRVDHSTAGAQHAATRFPGTIGRLLAYCIAGHHGGLPDNVDEQGGRSGLTDRLKKPIADFCHAAPAILLNQPRPPVPALRWSLTDGEKAFQAAIYCRMLFSCLVDADYLATEAFMRPDRGDERNRLMPTPVELLSHLDVYLERFAANTPVNRARANVLAQCRAKAELPPGFFSLTVPTGGGKTLSSLAFALTHAVEHGLRRVIYAIPFTSIIEQNASVFAEAFIDAGPHIVLEHHSNFDPQDIRGEDPGFESQTPWYRLAAENWDAPIVVTTNVQLFESLYASKPSRCRKLHRIARSVIILDECQTLPVTLLAPTLRMLEELVRNYGCTVVLCSATQPAITERPDFRIGIKGVREIVDDPPRLFESLKRVEVERLGKLDDNAVVERLRLHEQALCVVNTRAHAAKLFTALRDVQKISDCVFHLSASMCAAHRTDVLDEIRGRLNPHDPKPCIVISTQLIEAGVDIDFPIVYRAMTGLDSIAQAAGRCNREGRLDSGVCIVFRPAAGHVPPGSYRSGTMESEQVLRVPGVDL
ncbi:MAG: CRISPR-associated helicase Cas3', partial [Planctomycetota bacterium]